MAPSIVVPITPTTVINGNDTKTCSTPSTDTTDAGDLDNDHNLRIMSKNDHSNSHSLQTMSNNGHKSRMLRQNDQMCLPDNTSIQRSHPIKLRPYYFSSRDKSPDFYADQTETVELVKIRIQMIFELPISRQTLVYCDNNVECDLIGDHVPVDVSGAETIHILDHHCAT